MKFWWNFFFFLFRLLVDGNILYTISVHNFFVPSLAISLSDSELPRKDSFFEFYNIKPVLGKMQ